MDYEHMGMTLELMNTIGNPLNGMIITLHPHTSRVLFSSSPFPFTQSKARYTTNPFPNNPPNHLTPHTSLPNQTPHTSLLAPKSPIKLLATLR